MDLKTNLLQERARILKELEDTEDLLKSRCGWNPADNTDPPVKKPPTAAASAPLVVPDGRPYKIPSANNGAVHAGPIAYSREAELWLKEALPAFTAVDFRKWLYAKYGEDAVNESSVRGPFKILEESGRIVPLVQGQGRRPTTFRKA